MPFLSPLPCGLCRQEHLSTGGAELLLDAAKSALHFIRFHLNVEPENVASSRQNMGMRHKLTSQTLTPGLNMPTL